MKLSNFKDWISTALGCLLMAFAILGYYFGWPMAHSDIQALLEFCVGFVLLFTDPRAIALQVFEKLKGKL